RTTDIEEGAGFLAELRRDVDHLLSVRLRRPCSAAIHRSRGTHGQRERAFAYDRHSGGRHAMTIGAVQTLCSRIPWCEPAVLESSLELALEIAREGREGRRIGTLFTVGRADEVLAASRALILDPLTGHVPARTHISDPNLRGTMKELAQLDGAFVIS